MGAMITSGSSNGRPVSRACCLPRSLTKSVFTAPPGISEFTVTPVPAMSCAQISVSASMAVLLTP